ncbi:DHA2 family multidrug resistance protein-like MFS transporter [Xanthomonas arboricola]|uniref:MFS transporter n=1 Tax=Xanthomonas cannabis TaxID=1885674 RepID=UPI0016223A4A|nr:MFS transporter [Xanthomonas cannabis]MBB3801913.1 DHA2 family multidrug resistance protein-like MFS transporter [Xanthomonas cannabis]
MPSAHNTRWLLLITVAAGLLLITLDNSVLYTALPTLASELGASPAQALWIINAYPLVMAGLLLGSGTLGDRVGHRRMFLAGLAIFGAASLIAAFAPNATLLIAARGVLAIGAAAMMPATLALIRLAFEDERERNLAIAVWGCLSIVGSALGPIIGGLLLEHFWWGSVFLINVPIVALAACGAMAFAPEGKPDPTKSWDLPSSLLALSALSGLVFAIKALAHAPPSWSQAIVALAIAVTSGALFVRRQSTLTYPMLEFSIFRNPAFLSGTLAAAFAMFAIGGLQLLTTQRFQLVGSYTPMEAGLLVSAVALGSLPSALLGGAYLHKIGLRLLISGGLGLGALGVAIVSLSLVHGIGWVAFGLVFTGLGVSASMAVASSAIIGNVPADRAGMASSVEEVSYEFGSLIAVALLGSLVAALYSASLELPAGIGESARMDVAAAMALAREHGRPDVAQAAATAYDAAYITALYLIAAVMMIGSIITGVLLRRHGPGSTTSMVTH